MKKMKFKKPLLWSMQLFAIAVLMSQCELADTTLSDRSDYTGTYEGTFSYTYGGQKYSEDADAYAYISDDYSDDFYIGQVEASFTSGKSFTIPSQTVDGDYISSGSGSFSGTSSDATLKFNFTSDGVTFYFTGYK